MRITGKDVSSLVLEEKEKELLSKPMKYKKIAAKLKIIEKTLWITGRTQSLNREVGKISGRENRLRIAARIAIG